MAESALLYRMEVCFGALVTVSAHVLRSGYASLFVNSFLSCYRSSTGGAVLIHLIAGEA